MKCIIHGQCQQIFAGLQKSLFTSKAVYNQVCFNSIPTCFVGIDHVTDSYVFSLLQNKDTLKEDNKQIDKFECRATYLNETKTQFIEIIYEDVSLDEDQCVMKCEWMYEVLLE